MMKQKLIVRTDPDLPLLPLHGVMGGVTQAGEIEMLIYTDVDALPAPRELLLAEDGSLVNEEKASSARMRALERAAEESETAQKYAKEISNFVREGFETGTTETDTHE